VKWDLGNTLIFQNDSHRVATAEFDVFYIMIKLITIINGYILPSKR